MVPDKFNMVDMGGIDLIMMQGEEVSGLYTRLVESIAQCRYQCLYNWFFDGVVIPPTYVRLEVNEDDEVAINEGITVSPDDVIHIYSVEPGPVDPEIIPLLAEENGVYTVPAGKDGFNPVTVNVPSTGDVPLLSRSAWDALTTTQKREYGLVAIQDYITGYLRGSLYNGADYRVAKVGDYTPKYSWNASDNTEKIYTFEDTTPTNNNTLFCMGVMSQNGNNARWGSNLPVITSGTSGNGNYAIVYGDYATGVIASTYSGGNNWNNSEIVCFCLSGEVAPIIKELYYEQGQTGTYHYTYQATANENLLLIAMRGGSVGEAYTITGLTQISHVTSSGSRFNDVYFGSVENGDVVDISIPYAAGANSNGCLFMALISVEAEL